MSRTLPRLLLLAALLAGGPLAVQQEAGPGAADGHHRGTGGAGSAVLAAEPLDTSWGDDYVRPVL
ncbi:hypothetical protein [Streptomyces sp. NPDC056883]|uniref:hypothetical protein n=1 Tax=Streptomyces sp. NPDC056883 TaxID=3345959 RepID=UPI00367CCB8A